MDIGVSIDNDKIEMLRINIKQSYSVRLLQKQFSNMTYMQH